MGEFRREITSRKNDGMSVGLWLEPGHENKTVVTVDDDRTGEHYEVPVPDGSLAMEVFNHPAVYRIAELTVGSNVVLGEN